MERSPLRTLLAGYTLAAIAAMVCKGLDLIGFGTALLLFWIGGAMAVLGVAALGSAISKRAAIGHEASADDALRKWTEDLRRDEARGRTRRKA